jgi:hypothetical protein
MIQKVQILISLICMSARCGESWVPGYILYKEAQPVSPRRRSARNFPGSLRRGKSESTLRNVLDNVVKQMDGLVVLNDIRVIVCAFSGCSWVYRAGETWILFVTDSTGWSMRTSIVELTLLFGLYGNVDKTWMDICSAGFIGDRLLSSGTK